MMPMIKIENDKTIIEITFDGVAAVVDDNPAMLSIIATCYQQLCSDQHCSQEEQQIKPLTLVDWSLVRFPNQPSCFWK